MKFSDIKEAKEFLQNYKDIENFKVYGMQKFEYSFIAENFASDIHWDLENINIVNIDIEVGSENGFPDPKLANEEITAISLKKNNKIYVFGCGEFTNTRNDVVYYKCRDEIDLLKLFLDFWVKDYPDIITGWYIKFFDILYIVNRIKNILGEQHAKRLSPWNYISNRTVTMMNKDHETYSILGIAVYDYIELYRKFAPNGMSQENYKLDYICSVELGLKKLSYTEYGSLHNLYKSNYQKFIEYNIKDTELVGLLDDKLKLIELGLTLAYDSKSNFDDVFMQVRMWDSIIYNYLLKNNIIITPVEQKQKETAFVGAYVKEPQLGRHKWVASYDLNSLYPSLIMQFNIGTETIVDMDSDLLKINQKISDLEDLLEEKVDLSVLKEKNVTMSANGYFFTKNKQSFLAKIMEEMYNDRSNYKKKMLEAKKELQELNKDKINDNSLKKKEIEKKISRYNNLQLAKKVCLNSAYGTLGSNYFRFYDLRLATSITKSGQLVIRWIEKDVNRFLNKINKTTDVDYIIASDTDSLYIRLDELIEKIYEGKKVEDIRSTIRLMDTICNTKIQEAINKSCERLYSYLNCYAQKMNMKREALASVGVWTAKKRYLLSVYNNEGVEYETPDLKIVGLEAIKSSTPSACREKIKEALKIIVSGNEEQMIDFIDNFREEFKTLSETDISFPRGVNGISKYSGNKTMLYKDGTPIHVRGSIMYNNLLEKLSLKTKYQKIQEGEKIKFIYLKEPNIIKSNVLSFKDFIPEEFDIKKYIDYNTQFDKSFVEPLKIILDTIDWKTERKASLEDFF